jgi:hypothetical protein
MQNKLDIPTVELKRLLRFFDLSEPVRYTEVEENFSHFYCYNGITSLRELQKNLLKAGEAKLIRMDGNFRYYLTFRGMWFKHAIR